MEIDSIKTKQNPYLPITAKLNSKEFIGREELIAKLRIVLNDYTTTQRLTNFFICGDKAVGKTSLLNRYVEILSEHNFFVYFNELPRDQEKFIDEYDYFKDFLDQVFTDDYPEEGGVFDQTQAEIWFSLTSDKFSHESNYLERTLGFSDLYANKMLGRRAPLNYSRLEKDIKLVIKEVTKIQNQYKGVAFIIDEVQELTRNTALLDLLRKLSENINELIVITAGLPTYLDNPLFEKFIRTSEPFMLVNFNEEESLNLIFKPLENAFGLSRYECEKLFDGDTVRTLLSRTAGNPLHLRIILANLFDAFSKSMDKKEMVLDRAVMENVMRYYCSGSANSKKIKNSLESATKEQLDVFARLYKYEKLTLKAIILIELAFESIQQESQNTIKQLILNDLRDIYGLGLFYLEGHENNIDSIESLNTDQLSQVSFSFIGDSIDKLYAFYFYEDLTNKTLESNSNRSFEDHLAEKFSEEVSKSILRNNIHVKAADEMILHNMINKSTVSEEDPDDLFSTIDKIKNIDSSRDLSDEQQKMVAKLSFKYGFIVPAHFLSSHKYEGYYLLTSNVTIRGKTKILNNYFPVKANIDELHQYKEKITDYSSVINASLHEYNIVINWMYLTWIPKQPFIIIHYFNTSQSMAALMKSVEKREFREALKISEGIFKLNLYVVDKRLATQLEFYNNYGFCLLCMEDYEKANEIFGDIKDKYLLSNINYTFLLYCTKQYDKAWQILNSLKRKKFNELSTASFLHLMINHEKIKIENMIAENIYIRDHIFRNLTLLAAQTGKDQAIINTFINSIPNKRKNALDCRVRAWINYYALDLSAAIKALDDGLKKVDSKSNLYKDMEMDRSIIQSELKI